MFQNIFLKLNIKILVRERFRSIEEVIEMFEKRRNYDDEYSGVFLLLNCESTLVTVQLSAKISAQFNVNRDAVD